MSCIGPYLEYSTKIFDDDLKCVTNSSIMKIKRKFKIVKAMKFTTTSRSTHFLLNITFGDTF